MKNILEYLSTKVVSTSESTYRKVADKIVQYFGFEDAEHDVKKLYDCVLEWVEDNYVADETSLYPMCDQETYFEYEKQNSDIFKKVKLDFDTSYTGNERCQNELSDVEKENKISICKGSAARMDVYFTERMIACLGTIGTIYVWKDYDTYKESI